MTEGVRIDIVAGPQGAGKTTFIRQFLKSAPDERRIAVCDIGIHWSGIQGLAALRRPGRVLLEMPGDMGLYTETYEALNELTAWPAFLGARVAVIDAERYGRSRGEEGIVEAASHVFLNRTTGCSYAAKARILKDIWVINPKANIFVDPLDGLNLWMLLDFVPPDGLPWM